MPNPYNDIFNEDNEEEKKKVIPPKIDHSHFDDDRFPSGAKDPLDEILDGINDFNKEAESFSKLLSQIRVIEHKDEVGIARFFFASDDRHNKENLAGEKRYHNLLTSKFERILMPMRDLAQLHLKTIQQFNNNIDKDYYSVEKTDRAVESDKNVAISGINLQRKILADAASNLDILRDALIGTERRIKKYVNCGDYNNISSSEYEILLQKRMLLTRGRKHRFNYSFFDINLLDKTAISFGIYLKETTSQYMGKLMDVFDL